MYKLPKLLLIVSGLIHTEQKNLCTYNLYLPRLMDTYHIEGSI